MFPICSMVLVYLPTFGWFFGEMLGFIFQHHGAFYICEGLTKNMSRLWASDLPCCTAVRDGALYAASQWPSWNSPKKKRSVFNCQDSKTSAFMAVYGYLEGPYWFMFLVFPTCSLGMIPPCQKSDGRWCWDFAIPHRIHGAGIYANMTGVYWW